MGVTAKIVDAKELLAIAQNNDEDEFALICSRQGLVTRSKSERKIEKSPKEIKEIWFGKYLKI